MTIIYRPANVAAITAALVEQLANWAGIAALKVNVGRANELNETPGDCPWVGIYRDRVRFVSRTVGMGSAMRDQQVSLVVAVQEADGVSGEKCEDRLEALLAEVLAAILTDLTVGGRVRMIEDLEVRYADYRKVAGGSYMQTAAVYLTAVVNVSATDQ